MNERRPIFELILKFVLASFLFVMVVSATVQVSSRYIFSAPVDWTSELSSTLLVYITFLGTYLVIKRQENFRLTFLRDKLNHTRIGPVADGLVKLTEIAFLVLIIWYGVPLALELWNQTTVALGISQGWIAVAVPLGLIGMAFGLIRELWGTIQSLFGRHSESS